MTFLITHRDADISHDLLSVDMFGLIASESMTICALIDAIDDNDFTFIEILVETLIIL